MGKQPSSSVVQVLASAAALWDSLSVEGSRDKELEGNLKERFGCAKEQSLSEWLKDHEVPAEHLLVELFEAAGPYVNMWECILAMFTLAGARLGRHNLLISFEFSKLLQLKIDLSHFKAQVSAAQQAITVTGLEKWKPNTFWGLVRCIDRSLLPKADHPIGLDWVTRYHVGDPGVDNWIDSYLRDRIFPSALPLLKSTKNRQLDEQLAIARLILVAVVKECRLYGTRDALRAREHARPSLGGFGSQDLAHTDSDHTFASLLVAMWRAQTELALGLHVDKAQDLASQLHLYFKNEGIRIDFNGLASKVADLLSLPQWKRRHELYAVWLASIVIQNTAPESAEFHVVGDCLSFSFASSRLALVTFFNPPLDVWLEVRSPLEKPIGKGRKRNVQPDMVIYRGAHLEASDMPICVLEAKHYAKASTSFNDVLRDYSRAYPKADVALVNYGPVREWPSKEKPSARSIVAIGNCFPGGSGIDRLPQFLRSSLDRHYPPWKVEAASEIDRFGSKSKIDVWLKWHAHGPIDLDLHVIVVRSDATEEIYYGLKRSRSGSVQLSDDCRAGPGMEHATVSLHVEETYHFLVHVYGAEKIFRYEDAHVIINFEQKSPFVSRIMSPPDSEGHWWHAVTISGADGTWTQPNHVTLAAPFPTVKL